MFMVRLESFVFFLENLKEQYEKEKFEMEQHFSLRIQQVQEEFQRELSDTTELLKATHKKELGKFKYS